MTVAEIRRLAKNAANARWRDKNRERINARAREVRAKNPEPYREKARQYYYKHRTRILARYRRESVRKKNIHQATKWNKENYERAKGHRRKWYLRNRDRLRLYQREYYRRNREQILARRKERK